MHGTPVDSGRRGGSGTRFSHSWSATEMASSARVFDAGCKPRRSGSREFRRSTCQRTVDAPAAGVGEIARRDVGLTPAHPQCPASRSRAPGRGGAPASAGRSCRPIAIRRPAGILRPSCERRHSGPTRQRGSSARKPCSICRRPSLARRAGMGCPGAGRWFRLRFRPPSPEADVTLARRRVTSPVAVRGRKPRAPGCPPVSGARRSPASDQYESELTTSPPAMVPSCIHVFRFVND